MPGFTLSSEQITEIVQNSLSNAQTNDYLYGETPEEYQKRQEAYLNDQCTLDEDGGALAQFNEKIEQIINDPSKQMSHESFKQEFGGYLEQLIEEASGKKVLLALIDPQVAFHVKGAGLPVEYGEDVIVRQKLMLDYLAANALYYAHIVEIMTTRDLHMFGRSVQDSSSQKYIEAYGEVDAHALFKLEQKELKSMNPADGEYGIHATTIPGEQGTPDIQLVRATAEGVAKLEAHGYIVRHAGKILFSAIKAGLMLENYDPLSPLPNPQFTAQRVIDYVKQAGYGAVCVVGTCGNVCVQEFAEDLQTALREALENGEITEVMSIHVQKSLCHYLDFPPNAPASYFIQATDASLQKNGIIIDELVGFLPNPTAHRRDLLAEERVTEETQRTRSPSSVEFMIQQRANDGLISAPVAELRNPAPHGCCLIL